MIPVGVHLNNVFFSIWIKFYSTVFGNLQPRPIWYDVLVDRWDACLCSCIIYFTGLFFNIHIIEFPIFDTELVSNKINHALVSQGMQSIHPVCIRYLHSQLLFNTAYGDKYQWFILWEQILFM